MESLPVDLMTKVLGDYKGTVPITLITQKHQELVVYPRDCSVARSKICRYEEPSKGDKINEGIMKEITEEILSKVGPCLKKLLPLFLSSSW